MNNVMTTEEKRELTPYEKKLLIFFLKCIASELSKIVIFSIIFSILGLTKEFISALFFLMIFRTSSGGIHCHSYLGCLCVSFLILSSGMALGMFVYLPISIMIILTITIKNIIYRLAPVQSKTRPPLEERLVLKAKRRSSMSVVLYLILLVVCGLNTFTNIGFWLLVLHIVQLYIANKIRRYER